METEGIKKLLNNVDIFTRVGISMVMVFFLCVVLSFSDSYMRFIRAYKTPVGQGLVIY